MSGYFPKTALEEYIEGSRDLPAEEAELMVDEADQNATNAESVIDQARRLTETANVLEELAVVATRIERATPTEVRLIERVSDMAAAGTNIAPQNFVPSMESYIGQTLAMESTYDKAKKIVEIVLAYLSKFWQTVTDFFKLAFVIPNMLELIKERLQILKRLGEPLKDKKEVKFEQRFSDIQVDGSIPFVIPVSGGKQASLKLRTLTACISQWNMATEYVYESYLKEVATSAGHVATALNEFDLNNPLKTADGLEAKLGKSRALPPPNSRKGANTTEDDIVFSHHSGQRLFGNVALELTGVESTSKAADTLAALNGYKKVSLRLDELPSNAPNDSIDFMSMDLMSKEEIEDLLKEARNLLTGMSDFYVGTEWRAINKVRAEVERAAKNSQKNIEQIKDPNSGAVPSATAEEYYRSIIDFGTVFGGWVQSPTMDMYRKTLKIARVLIAITDEHMRAYEVK